MENSDSIPLPIRYADAVLSVIKIESSQVAADIKPNSKANFEFYAWKAAKTPYKTAMLDLIDGRIPLREILQEEGIINLYRIDSDGLVLLLADNDGLSIQKWVNNRAILSTLKLPFPKKTGTR